MKNSRHRKILEIISEYNIETQDELIEQLRESGIEVTQATISRDIRDLKLIKISSDDNRYKYSASPGDDTRISAKYRNIIRETVVKVDFANNIAVLKTYSGMAQAAAAAIDGMSWTGVVGSIAGDDTIFVLMRERNDALDFVEKFRSILRGL